MIRTEDVYPMAEFKAHLADHLAEVQATGRPHLVTRDGQPQGVLLSLCEYQKLIDDAQLVRDQARYITQQSGSPDVALSWLAGI